MEKKELYPKGIVKQTDEFALRQKIKKLVGDNVEETIKEATIDAFKELGFEEKDGYMYVLAAGGKDGGEKEVGKGTANGKLIVTVSVPKMLNMGAVKPVSYMQKVSTFGGKKLVSEIYLEIQDETVHVEYKNTEAAAFHQSSEKDSYSANKLNKRGIISGTENEKTFKKEFKEFFKPIAEAEARYLIGTKIANDDKVEKNMNDSIVKENKYSMKLTNILSSSYEDAGNQIEKTLKEYFFFPPEDDKEKDADKEKKGEKGEEESGSKTPETSTGKPTDKKLVIGSEEKIEENEKSLEEITATLAAPAGPTQASGTSETPNKDSAGVGFAKKFGWGEHKDDASKKLGYEKVQMDEAVKNTTYGIMRTARPHLQRQEDGSYKLITESQTPKTPYSDVVPMGKDGWPPKGMESNFALGKHGVRVNSPEELKETGHGELSKLEKETEEKKKKEEENKKVEENYKKKLDLTKRKFTTLSENEESGINKRYIITEKLSKEDQSKRWKELYENDCFCKIKDQTNTISREDYDKKANKEFEANNPPMESNLCNTQFSGEEPGFVDVPKAKGSMIVFRISESDIKQNKIYLIDHFTKKLVSNPLYKSGE